MPVEPLLGAKWRKAPPLPCWSGEKHLWRKRHTQTLLAPNDVRLFELFRIENLSNAEALPYAQHPEPPCHC